MQFRILGTLEAERDGRLVPLGGPRQRAVLAALLLRANQTVSVEYLAQAVWEMPPAAPESNLRTYVAGLRRRLTAAGEDADRLRTRPGGYLLTVAPGELDLHEYQRLLASAEQATRAGDLAAAVAETGRALALRRDRPLAGQEVGTLLRGEFALLEEQRLAALERLNDTRLALGQPADAAADLHRLVAEYPLREELAALLMRALAGTGQRAEALETFARARTRLVEELGIEPGPLLRRVQHEILTAGAEPAASEPPATEPATLTAYRQLPMDIAEFTGRTDELDELLTLAKMAAAGGSGPGGTVVICAIGGMAGIGKTRLAIRGAYRLLADGYFTDVQLWADLRGFDANLPPTEPAAVLDGFLRLLGVPPEQIPKDLESRARLYRDRLVGRSALILLDNAASEDQVQPLLPASHTCLVLVTSRHGLTGLDGANPLPLGLFTRDQGVTLLARIAGHERIAAEPEAAATVVDLCGNLPIAITFAGRRLRARPAWRVADLAARLTPGDRRLAELTAGSRAVRSAFGLSYAALDPARQRAFRLLSLHPGTDFGVSSAAALLALADDAAETALEGLLDEHLLDQATGGRYRFHDLIRVYAAELCAAHDEVDQRRDAVRRVVDFYLHTARAASGYLYPNDGTFPLDPPADGVRPLPLDSYEAALAWCDTERADLVAAVATAGRYGLDRRAWQLPRLLWIYFYLSKHWADWEHVIALGLAAARRVDDRDGECQLLVNLGIVHDDNRRHAEAVAAYEAALALGRQTGNRRVERACLINLGIAYRCLGRLEQSLEAYRRSLELCRDGGDRRGEGVTLLNMGNVHAQLGASAEAITSLEASLEIAHRINDLVLEGNVLVALAEVLRTEGRYAPAAGYCRQAAGLLERGGDRSNGAEALHQLGNVLGDAGDTAGAREAWGAAAAIFEELGDPRAADLRARISG